MADAVRHRRRGLIALLVLAAVTATAGGCWARAEPATSPSCARVSMTPPPSATTPATGGISVVESGFTQTDTGSKVTIGAIVENTSAMIAFDARVRFSALDAAGASAERPESDPRYFAIPVVMPGERLGVGAWTDVRSTQPEIGNHVGVASIGVQLSGGQWLDPGLGFAVLPTTHEGMLRSQDGRSTTLQFSAQSPYRDAVAARGVASVFRNQAGVIIGGSFDGPAEPTCEPGLNRHTVDAFVQLPAEVDDAQTRDYLYCDPTRRAPYPVPVRTSGAPFNP